MSAVVVPPACTVQLEPSSVRMIVPDLPAAQPLNAALEVLIQMAVRSAAGAPVLASDHVDPPSAEWYILPAAPQIHTLLASAAVTALGKNADGRLALTSLQLDPFVVLSISAVLDCPAFSDVPTAQP